MRVLIAHNRYMSRSPSGENQAVADDIDLLRSAGVAVDAYLPSSDRLQAKWGRVGLAAGAIHNSQGLRYLEQYVSQTRPDIVHVHNLFPGISPAFISSCRKFGLPIVQTFHNYRLRCMSGDHHLHGQECFRCKVGNPVPGVLNGCYRGSRAQSLVMAGAISSHQVAVKRHVNQVVCLTNYMASWAAACGIPTARISVRPTWAPDPGAPQAPPNGSRVLLFAGRLDRLKGTDSLLAAWNLLIPGLEPDMRLMIAGAGPMEDEVASFAAGHAAVDFVGRLSQADMGAAYQRATAVVVPSHWLEGFPRVIAEAFSYGRPVVVSRNLNLASIVDEHVGWLADDNPESLAAALIAALREASNKTEAVRSRYLAEMAPSESAAKLLEIYGRAAEDLRRRPSTH